MKNKLSRFAVPYVVWMALMVVIPIFIMVVYAFTTAEFEGTMDNFSEMGTYASVFLRSFRLAIIATLVCLLIGYPVAYWMAHEGPAFQRVAMALIMLPMWMNFLLRTYSWMSILENNGLLNQFFRAVGLLDALGVDYIPMIGTPGAVVLGMVYNYLPFMILPIYSVIVKLDGSLLEAARDLGADNPGVFRKVILPLSLPGVLSGVTMVFVPSVSTFAISRLLGGGNQIMLGDLIEQQFLGGAYDPHLGAAISMVMMVIVVVCMVVMNRFGEGEEGGGYAVRKQSRAGSRLIIGLMFLFLYAPILLLVVFSFNAGDSSAVWKGFSLHWYGRLFQNRLIMESVYTTLLVSLLATAIATVAGTFAAIGLYSLGRKKREALLTINNIPMVNADIVTGVSLCLFFVAFFQGWGAFAGWLNSVQSVVELPERLVLGFTTLLLAHVAFNIPYVILNVAPKLRQMDRNLMDAAQDLGCTWMQAFWKVMLPEIKPGIVSGALIAFTMSIDDFIISYFTAGSSSSTLAMAIYGMTKKRVTPEVNAVSTLLFLSVLVLLVLSNIKEVRAEARERVGAARKASALERLNQKVSEPRFKWVRRGTAAALACAFVALTAFLSYATGSRPVVNVCSWGEYIDEDLIGQFEEATGIRVNYQTAESNEALYSLLKSGGADYDVVVPSDYMIGRLISEDMLEKLDYSQIPNVSLIDDRFKNLSYDPANEYTVPYAWGTLGIIYNTAMVDEEITSWSALYDDKYAGNVLLINNSRDALGEALLYLGYSVNTTNEAEIREAYGLVADASRRGVFQGRVMDEVFQKMEGGNAAIATYYAGDYISMLENNEDLAFVIPEEGSNWFVDAMCMLKGAPHQREAHMWINFIASTEANLANMHYIGYASPNREALEGYPDYYREQEGEELDPELYEIMAAQPETLARCEAYRNLPADTLNVYKSLWTQLGIE